VLAVTALAGAAREREREKQDRRSTTWFAGRRGSRDIPRLALAGIGARAARLVDGDGDDLQGRRTARLLASGRRQRT